MALSAGRSRLQRGDEGQRHGEHQRDHGRHAGQEQRHRQALQDQVHHRRFKADRRAEIALENALDEYQELHRNGLVEAEIAIDALDVGIGRAVAEHGARRIARQQPHEDEGDDEDEDQCRDDLQQPAENKTQARQSAGLSSASLCEKAARQSLTRRAAERHFSS